MTSLADLRAELALATRLCAFEGMLDHSGHISARLPGQDAILIQSGKSPRASLSPADIIIVDMDGRVRAGTGKPPLETALHLTIMRARPDIQAVLHSHWLDAVSCTLMHNTPLQILRPGAARWRGGIPVHPFAGSISSTHRGDALAATLGDRHAALLRAHGMVLGAESIRALVHDAVYFADNVEANLLVLHAGRERVPLTEAELELMETPREFNIEKLWAYCEQRARAAGALD